MIRLSVALVTRNRPESLARTLRSLREQDVQPFEVVVSDDSDEGLAFKTAQVATEFGCRYLRGPRKGLYYNRNFIAENCVGSHVRTMDDDHLFPPGHFRSCLEAIEKEPELIWTTGEVGFVDGRLFGATPVAFQLHPAGVACIPDNFECNWAIADGSTMYPRFVFQRGYRFVEEFGYGSSYLEFGAFLFSRGHFCRCLVGTVVEHFGGKETISRDSLNVQVGRMFASLAFNLYFRPSKLRGLRYLIPLILRSPSSGKLLRKLPSLLQTVKRRWKGE